MLLSDLSPDVLKAREFAIEAHGDQKYGQRPYVYHLDYVVQVLNRFHHSMAHRPILLVAAYLHDVLEDTDVSDDCIIDSFGGSVWEVVDAVTRREGVPVETLFRGRTAKFSYAVVLKMADRIANIEYSLAAGSTVMLKKYQKQHHLFKSVLCADSYDNYMFRYLSELHLTSVGRTIWDEVLG